MSMPHIRICGESIKATALAVQDGATQAQKGAAQEINFQYIDSHPPVLLLSLWQIQQALALTMTARMAGNTEEAKKQIHIAFDAAAAVEEIAKRTLPGRHRKDLDG